MKSEINPSKTNTLLLSFGTPCFNCVYTPFFETSNQLKVTHAHVD